MTLDREEPIKLDPTELLTNRIRDRLRWKLEWIPYLVLLFDIVCSTIVFVCLGLGAAAISLFITWLSTLGVDSIVVTILRLGEYFLLVTDLSGFIYNVYLAVRKIGAGS